MGFGLGSYRSCPITYILLTNDMERNPRPFSLLPLQFPAHQQQR
jgi:hypothetical protein